MIFFDQPSPKGAALRQKRGNPRPLPVKSGKTIQSPMKKEYGIESLYSLLFENRPVPVA
ncbi:hypothetical protein M5E82_13060 [Parabacteroides distasonis]|nr:hypothetical protein M5E82_13060 [Parabacteroides distasonis]